MIFSEIVYKFMLAALNEAERGFNVGEVPVGAVIVYDEKIIGKGYNQVERLNDPTAHAEMIAITSAANYLGNWRLNDCDLFVTLEPCMMCTGALMLSRIRNIYLAAFDPKFGACGSIYNLVQEDKYNHKVNVYSGIYSDESTALLKKFFADKRSKNDSLLD